MKLLPIAALALGLLLVAACSREEDPEEFDCTGLTPTYTADIKPILDANCALSGCHDAITVEQGKNLSTYDGAKAASQNDDFLGAIQHKSGFSPMPRNAPKLSDELIKRIGCWVQNGAPQ